MSACDVIAPTSNGERYAVITSANELVARRLEYCRQHGAGFLFRNEPPPAPGWPRLRGRKVEM